MDLFLDRQEYANYRVWLHSPSVHGSETETILAYKIGHEINGIPSRILRILRGVPGQDPDLMKRVEDFVERDGNLFFVGEGEGRTVDVVEANRGEGGA